MSLGKFVFTDPDGIEHACYEVGVHHHAQIDISEESDDSTMMQAIIRAMIKVCKDPDLRGCLIIRTLSSEDYEVYVISTGNENYFVKRMGNQLDIACDKYVGGFASGCIIKAFDEKDKTIFYIVGTNYYFNIKW